MKSLALLALALSSCSFVMGAEGSGIEKSEVRALPDFERIYVAGSADGLVRVGGAPGIKLSCDDNLLAHVITEVEDGTLRISMKRGNYRFKKGLRYEVSAPSLSKVSLAGSGDMAVQGLASDVFEVSIAGSGKIDAAGRAKHVAVDVAGSGDVALLDVVAETAYVDIAGSGDAAVSVARDLDVRIAGSGSVRYRGDPRITKWIAGSGEIVRD